MYEYDMLHPQHEEETELTCSAKDEIALEERIYAAYCSGRNDSLAGCTFEAKSKQDYLLQTSNQLARPRN